MLVVPGKPKEGSFKEAWWVRVPSATCNRVRNERKEAIIWLLPVLAVGFPVE